MRSTCPKICMQLFTNSFAIVLDFLFGIGMTIRYFENSQMIVIAYYAWLTVVWKGPIVSMETDWNGLFGVAVNFNFSFLATFGLLIWHLEQFFIYFAISFAIPFHLNWLRSFEYNRFCPAWPPSKQWLWKCAISSSFRSAVSISMIGCIIQMAVRLNIPSAVSANSLFDIRSKITSSVSMRISFISFSRQNSSISASKKS